MGRTTRVLVVVCLVVSTGCVSLSGQSLPDQLAGYASDPDDPYHAGTLTVAIEENGTDRTFAPEVRRALTYWQNHGERYLNYSVNFTLASNASDPDLRVSFVPALDHCGDVEHAAGCSPEITSPIQTGDTVDIRVLDNLSSDSTVHVLKHEFGHALGLGHGDQPQAVMAPRATLTSVPKPNASDRPIAWDDPNLSVFVTGTVSTGDREQIDHALDYYAGGADGRVPKNVSFHRVENPRHADISIRFTEDSTCRFGTDSCGSVFGTDGDGDGALEHYTHLEITLTDLDTDAVGWHVARWLGLGFGMDDESDYPPPLRENTSYDQRRSEWWQ